MGEAARVLDPRVGARNRHAIQVKRARSYTEDFIEFAIRDEFTDRRLKNARHHLEWQEFLRDHRMAVLVAPVEHAKTQQIGVGKALHLIGDDPRRRIALIGNTATMAAKSLNAIRTHIELNPRVHEVFPELRKSPRDGDPWGQKAITVERDTIAKEPTIQALGAYGDVVGSRLDGIIIDDILDFENTRTAEQREKLVEWFDTTVFTRLTDGGFIYVIGTPWHPEDLLHVLATRPDFASCTYSAVHNPEAPQDEWRPLWDKVWSRERLVERARNMPETVFSRKYLCRVRLESTARFKAQWWDRCVALGRGRTMLDRAPLAQGGVRRLRCFTGVDLGIGKKKENALSVLFTIAVMDDFRRLIVDIQSGRWHAPEILQRLEEVYRRYQSDIFVENVGAQDYIVQMCEGHFPVDGFTTGRNKWDEEFGVESLAVEWRNLRWVVPSGASGEAVDEECNRLRHDMLYYNPEQHTGDHLMAMWLTRECLRTHIEPRQKHLDTVSR